MFRYVKCLTVQGIKGIGFGNRMLGVGLKVGIRVWAPWTGVLLGFWCRYGSRAHVGGGLGLRSMVQLWHLASGIWHLETGPESRSHSGSGSVVLGLALGSSSGSGSRALSSSARHLGPGTRGLVSSGFG